MLRKRNAYYQEMGEAYEVIRQEEDYTVPSYKVRPPKRRKIYSDHQMQSVNLQQMNEQIDRMQEKEQEKNGEQPRGRQQNVFRQNRGEKHGASKQMQQVEFECRHRQQGGKQNYKLAILFHSVISFRLSLCL